MQKPSDILKARRDEVLAIISGHRGQNPRVFGSVLHGTDTTRSDIDILVDVPAGTGMLTLGAMQFALQESLGIPVDVLTPGDLPPRLRNTILSEAKPL